MTNQLTLTPRESLPFLSDHHAPKGTLMLIRLLRSHLRPYSGQIVLIVLAQLVSTMASLYLPSLNGEIIDEGVAKGDTGFILSHGALMLGVSLVQIAAAVGRRPSSPPGSPWRWAATSAVGVFGTVVELLGAGGHAASARRR